MTQIGGPGLPRPVVWVGTAKKTRLDFNARSPVVWVGWGYFARIALQERRALAREVSQPNRAHSPVRHRPGAEHLSRFSYSLSTPK